MLRLAFLLPLAAAFLATDASAQSAAPAQPSAAPVQVQLTCDVGPVRKVFGGGLWQVRSCRQHPVLVITSAPDSPASPSQFIMFPAEGGYRLQGEGTGDRDATLAAVDDLKKLTFDQIIGLIEETRQF